MWYKRMVVQRGSTRVDIECPPEPEFTPWEIESGEDATRMGEYILEWIRENYGDGWELIGTYVTQQQGANAPETLPF